MNDTIALLDRPAAETTRGTDAGHEPSAADIRWAETRRIVAVQAPLYIGAQAADGATLDAVTGIVVDMLAATGLPEAPESMISSYATMTLAGWVEAL